MSSPAPDPGQLVEVRRRPFVVVETQTTALPIEPLRGGTHANGRQHLVTLSSIEDDALGEEMRVIWELEPGARAFERMALPTPQHGFDDPRRLDAFLDAVRWGAISSADVRALQSPFRSGIAIEDYQLDPVVRALQMPRVNLLVADDVGLGKTIEAGLVIQELLLRYRARTVLVVCPSALQVQWRDQMRDKFGLEFRIVDSALMKDLRRRRGLHTNPWTHFPRLITSIDYLKREHPQRLFREVLPPGGEATYPRLFDLLIVDEAHNVAPSGGGRYATDSQRTEAVRLLAPHFEHKLFLTATPHNGYQESFTALLEILDNQRFARGVAPDRAQLGAVMVRRLKSELPPRWDRTARFPRRELTALEVPYTEAERQAHRALHEYTQLRQKGMLETERFATEFVLKLLKKRLFSCPAAFVTTLAKHRRSLDATRSASALHARPSPGLLRRQVEGIDEEFADDDIYEEATHEAVDVATRLFRPLFPRERVLLDELDTWARGAAAGLDTKAAELLHWLGDTLRPGGAWNDERVIIFTEYRDTQKWLIERLAAHGFTQEGRLMTLHGGMQSDERERVKAAFQAHPHDAAVRILLATDAASEGINLQNYCARLIHYEIPWNPNRMEQRNGRIDRHGQRAPEVLIYHFVGAGYQADVGGADWQGHPGDLEGDLEFLMRAARKVTAIREDLGKVGPVIAAQVEQAMLGQRRGLDTARAEAEALPIRALLRTERALRERIERLHEQLQETKAALHLTPENIHNVVTVGLALAGQPPLLEAQVPGLWPDPSGRIHTCPVWHLPALTGSWALCSEGLAHPHTGSIRPIVFDHDLAEGRDDVVLAHLGHRLVAMCLRLLRAEIWSAAGDRPAANRLHRVTARVIPSSVREDPIVVAHGRLVVLGGDSRRLHEEVITAGGVLRQGRFARLGVGETEAAMGAALPDSIPPALQDHLATIWPDHAEMLQRALEARMGERVGFLQRLLEGRAEKEVADSKAILAELRKSILEELDQPDVVQLELFTTPERDQFERNMSALRARAERIPAEMAAEEQIIRARYASPTPRLFPVAITYLIPQRVALQAERSSH